MAKHKECCEEVVRHFIRLYYGAGFVADVPAEEMEDEFEAAFSHFQPFCNTITFPSQS